MCDRCLMAASDHWRARMRAASPRVPQPQDPAALTACTIAVWSAYGRLLWAALPVETARQWVARGEASVETPHAICCYTKEDDHA